MEYHPQAPLDDSPLARWVHDELQQIEKALTEFDNLQLPQLNIEPQKPRDGVVVYADGVNWNPGGGEGLYIYFGGTWNKLEYGSFQPLDAFLTQISNLSDPGSDRILFWDDSDGIITWLSIGAPLNITGTVLDVDSATDSAEGVVEKATAGEVRSAASNKFVSADLIESASAGVALSDAATVAVDWDSGINFTLTVTADRVIGNPTNGQPGTWRTILVQGNDATDRTITFGNQYGGEPPTITDCDSTKKYLLMIYCKSSSQFLVSAMDGSDA